jgi:PiT family inorganic phosphate transporter
MKFHILSLDAYTRVGFIIVGAFASYSLGANNIANVMGLFVSATPFGDLNLFNYFTITGAQQLFFLGGLAIAVGIFTYSYRVMLTVGDELYKITPISGLVVVLSEALVLFVFASEGLEKWLGSNGLPTIPLVPLSSTQVVIGAVIGVGIAKGGKGINYKVLSKIAFGWVVAPLAACLLALVALFVVQNVFEQKVVELTSYKITLPVIKALEQEDINTNALEPLKGRLFLGAAGFRHTLRNKSLWTEKELFKIFSFAELDSMKVDSVRAKAQCGDLISSEQFRAVCALHGRSFVHRWQLDTALVKESQEWKLQKGTGYEAVNKKIKQQYHLLYQAFQK